MAKKTYFPKQKVSIPIRFVKNDKPWNLRIFKRISNTCMFWLLFPYLRRCWYCLFIKDRCDREGDSFKDKRLEVVLVQIKWNCASYKVKGDMFYHRNRYNGTILTLKSWFLWFSSMKFLHKLSNYRGRYSWGGVTSHLFYVIVLHIVKWPIRTFHWSIAVTWHVWQLWFSPKIPSSIQHL